VWIAAFVTWLGAREAVISDRLGELYGDEHKTPSSACGVLSFPYHRSDSGQLLFFRKEFKETLNWAGNPNDGVKAGPLGTRLTPRGSFELFQETTQGQSRNWSEVDVALAHHLGERLTQRVLEWTSEQDRLRNLLVGMIGHDLRTPLGAIRMGAELLGGENPIARRMASSSHRMTGLVESLLDLNQIQSERGLGIRHEHFDLHEVCRNLAGEARMAFPGMKIETAFSGPTHVEADRVRIQQAVSNLLSNARHHGDVGRDITLLVEDGHGDSSKISVHNWGTPIDPDVKKTLFKPYQGVQRRGDRRSGGLGLGLYITRSIILLHGGEVSVSSDAEHGTTFTLILPRAAQKAPHSIR
jgi:light-regulated signal transduction histidine kinase (bacteriophytochrome)